MVGRLLNEISIMKTELIIALIVASVAFVWALWYVLGCIQKSRDAQMHEHLRRQRKTRINAKAPEHGLVFAAGVAIQLNADNTLPEWVKLAPFGKHPTRDKKAVQVFNAAAADQIISWFNFFPRKLARLANINSVKVWVGHPDFAPNEWPERIDLGSVVELKRDDTDLWGKVRWNAGALQHVTKHKFPSVAWDCEVNGDGTETPAFLWSVGMWHKPNIKSVSAVINAADDTEDSDPEAEIESPETQNEETPMLKNIMAALVAAGIVKESDDENSVLGAIGSMISSLAWKREEEKRQAAMASQMRTALNAVADVAELPDDALPEQTLTQLNAVIVERGTLAAKVVELNAQFKAEREARINTVIERALETGRVTKADEGKLREQLNAAPETAIEELLARPVQLNCKPLSIGGAKPKIMEAQQRTTHLNAWISARMDSHKCSYDAAWSASLSDPETKGIHEAVAAADAARATTAD